MMSSTGQDMTFDGLTNNNEVKVVKHVIYERACGDCMGKGVVRRSKDSFHPCFDTWKKCKECKAIGTKKYARAVNI